jgi:hypothetical protein
LKPNDGASLRWEMGSEFSWCGLPEPPFLSWPHEVRWHLLARHSVADVVLRHAHSQPTLWLPSYFCSEVAEHCTQYFKLREYLDDPRSSEPDWDSLQPQAQDFVLAVNYFGVREPMPWREWRKHAECFLLEDHSQDPFSPWSLDSNAEYAFASLRKTLPLPDGALLWSPRGLALPDQLQQHEGDWTGSALKMAAMFAKADYLCGKGTTDLKPHFRNLQLRGEQRLRGSRISSISPYSRAYIANGVPVSWREQRLLNARCLLGLVPTLEFAEFLFRSWPDGAVPFVLPLIFSTTQERDRCQAHLQRNQIYCPVHWVCQTREARSLDLSARMLSLPIDQRYGAGDMTRLADCLSSFPAASQGRAGHAAEGQEAFKT